ncbi:MAG: universal stress protein, partial [Acidimicrobiia bacterium]|nr:universal stress protein [Acidimicrobiia bacterium]
MHIIVGVDESASGEAALRWALRVAALAGASVEAVRSWVYSPVPSRQLLPADEMDRLAEAGLNSTIASQSAVGIAIRTTVVRGPAHHAMLDLIDQRRPDLVVVGRRGGNERALPRALGSVSRRLVDASPCPVAVVTEDRVDAGPTPLVMVAVD